MSCKDEAEKESGALEESSRVALGQANGAQLCTYPNCGKPLDKAGECPDHHPQGGVAPVVAVSPEEEIGIPPAQRLTVIGEGAKPTGPELYQRVQERLQTLAAMVDEAAISEEMQRYLQAMGQFHGYSFNNQFLILFGCLARGIPPGRAASFDDWKRKFKRHVKKGEHGLPIIWGHPHHRKVKVRQFNPATGQTEEKEEERTGITFGLGHVFVECQTEGEPLPQPPQWTVAGAEGGEIYEQVRALADAAGVPVAETMEHMDGETQGWSDAHKGEHGEIGIREGLTPRGKMATLLHEWAHNRMHPADSPLPRRQKELEAEACAWVVAEHFGYPLESAPNYIALHHASGAEVGQCMARIAKTASEIISAIEEGTASAQAAAPEPAMQAAAA